MRNYQSAFIICQNRGIQCSYAAFDSVSVVVISPQKRGVASCASVADPALMDSIASCRRLNTTCSSGVSIRTFVLVLVKQVQRVRSIAPCRRLNTRALMICSTTSSFAGSVVVSNVSSASLLEPSPCLHLDRYPDIVAPALRVFRLERIETL